MELTYEIFFDNDFQLGRFTRNRFYKDIVGVASLIYDMPSNTLDIVLDKDRHIIRLGKSYHTSTIEEFNEALRDSGVSELWFLKKQVIQVIQVI